jgi:hypothetical protein
MALFVNQKLWPHSSCVPDSDLRTCTTFCVDNVTESNPYIVDVETFKGQG